MTAFKSMAVNDLLNGDFTEEESLEMADVESAALKDMAESERYRVLLAEVLKAPIAEPVVKVAS